MRKNVLVATGTVAIACCAALYVQYTKDTVKQRIRVMDFLSPAFDPQAAIPSKYTCDGQDISPELTWKNEPLETKSFALICQDPDAPHGTWVHWVMYDIPASVHKIAEGATAESVGAIAGQTSWGVQKKGYGGPCPPHGMHRYFFILYALAVSSLRLAPDATAQEVKDAMEGHVLEFVELMGTYQRK
ncbi:MAG TPA: YbhB/YbcL family Raf kinase inhibitor-like protein [Candidatus Bathyarchaeia archaeon]|nr:YbhB/YbcL family Raf kinase inhibitor-like protein [Candidatus Bathyarchaeia archaeon]